jgi:hypothetical protein
MVLAIVSLTLTLFLGSALIADGLQEQVRHSKMQAAAHAAAVSGADYAQAMLRWGRWKGNERVASPDLGQTGHFEVILSKTSRGVRIISKGEAGAVTETMVRMVP